MTPVELRHLQLRLERTVSVLCPLIEQRFIAPNAKTWAEANLRRDVVACMLGSQVSHKMAMASLDNLAHAGLLDEGWWQKKRSARFEARVYEVLAGRARGLPHSGSYRFPRTCASQLAQLRDRLSRWPLLETLRNADCAKQLRRSLSKELPGLGPKQASMFLRNVGCTYDLAILDVHVMRFMVLQGVVSSREASIRSLSDYERTEAHLVRFASGIGYPVGYLDWAIWATMKAAREIGL